jgi:acyl carrier protein
MRAYVLDGDRRLVPIGVSGELYLAGVGLARGYLGRPELDAERFLADPFDDRPEARMYRTGDLVRWTPDGTLEFLGRNDHQVKIRGFRIELGEIEARITADDRVGDAVVVAREDVAGDRRLVGYLVPTDPADQGSTLVGHVREALRASLPQHLVPSEFVVLDALPLTPNGKVDRKALPAPELGAHSARRYEPPADGAEEVIAAICREVLHVDRIGRQDDFFDLGGHSLLATQMAARLSEVFQVDLPLKEFFGAPTIAGIAGQLAALCGGPAALEDLATAYTAVSALSDEEVAALLAGHAEDPAGVGGEQA